MRRPVDIARLVLAAAVLVIPLPMERSLRFPGRVRVRADARFALRPARRSPPVPWLPWQGCGVLEGLRAAGKDVPRAITRGMYPDWEPAR